MLSTIMKRVKGRYWVVAVAIGIGVASATGCATESPKPVPTMTPEQVKANADKSFERLKQEEKNRALGSGAVSY